MNNKHDIIKDDCNGCNKIYKTYKTLWGRNKKFHNNNVNNVNTNVNTNVNIVNIPTIINNIKKYNCNKCGKEFNCSQGKYQHKKK